MRGGGAGDNAGIICPPPLIFAAFLLLAIALNAVWPVAIVGADLSDGARRLVASLPADLALIIAVIAFVQFRKHGTPVRPDRPTTALVTTGPYRYSRNPLYVSLTLVYLAIALALDNFWAFVLIVPVLMFVHIRVIAREEVYLERKFGAPYLEYRARVRRWL